MTSKAERGPDEPRSAEVISLRLRRARAAWRKAMPPGLLLATLTALGLGLAVTWALLLISGHPGRPTWWVGTVPLAVCMAVPFLVMALSARWLSAVRKAAWVNLVAAVVLPALPVIGALQLLFTAANRLNRSYFIFATLFMAAAYVPFLGVAILFHRRSVEP